MHKSREEAPLVSPKTKITFIFVYFMSINYTELNADDGKHRNSGILWTLLTIELNVGTTSTSSLVSNSMFDKSSLGAPRRAIINWFLFFRLINK